MSIHMSAAELPFNCKLFHVMVDESIWFPATLTYVHVTRLQLDTHTHRDKMCEGDDWSRTQTTREEKEQPCWWSAGNEGMS